MAAAKKKAPNPAKFAPPADPDIWPDIDVLTDDQIARAKRCWDAYDATKVGEVAVADLGGMLRALGFRPSEVSGPTPQPARKADSHVSSLIAAATSGGVSR